MIRFGLKSWWRQILITTRNEISEAVLKCKYSRSPSSSRQQRHSYDEFNKQSELCLCQIERNSPKSARWSILWQCIFYYWVLYQKEYSSDPSFAPHFEFLSCLFRSPWCWIHFSSSVFTGIHLFQQTHPTANRWLQWDSESACALN